MMNTVKVVVVNSLSYTGTTWLNVIIGCHERAFSLGPPDRVWNMLQVGKEDGKKACLVHGDQCKFWPCFFEDYKKDENFFVQLSGFSHKDIIVTNNPLPQGAGSELHDSAIMVKSINLIRDGRALMASYMRKNKGSSAIDAIANFLYPSFHDFYFDENNPDILCLRYEDVLQSKQEGLVAIGGYLGVFYEMNALKFWEYEHHITSGNQGTIACIKFGQDIPVPDFRSREFYEKQFLEMKAGKDTNFNDERWRHELSRRELFLFDLLCGDENQHFGYKRDQFSLNEISGFVHEIRRAKKGGAFPDSLAGLIDERLRALLGQMNARNEKSTKNSRIYSGVRQQMSPNWIRRYGISLTPEQIKLLFPYMIVGGIAFLSVLVLIVVMVCYFVFK